MAIFAIGHGSGMAVKQCSSSEVSAGVILGNVPPVGWYCCLSAVAFFALLRVCSGRHVYFMNDFPVSVYQHFEIFACSDGSSTCVRAVFDLVLVCRCENIPCLILRSSVWYIAGRGFAAR